MVNQISLISIKVVNLQVKTTLNIQKNEDIRQSMDGKARWVDNVVIER